MSSYSQYRGRSCGRIIHCLDTYCGLRVADSAQIGDGKISLFGKLFATYTWPEDTEDDKPHLCFARGHSKSDGKDMADYYEEQQFRKRPYLDDSNALMFLEYAIQEVRKCLSFDDALAIRHDRDYFNSEWKVIFRKGLVEDIKKEIVRATHGYLDPEKYWKHFAFCAVYSI